MLVGNLLAVRPAEVAQGRRALRRCVGLLHWFCRRPFFLISTDPDAAYADGWRVRLWDFLFYASFGVVVASSVRIAGVLLVFSYLIVPALAGVALGGSVTSRLLIGWGFGTLVSVLGMVGLGRARPADRRHRRLRVRPHPERVRPRLSPRLAARAPPVLRAA